MRTRKQLQQRLPLGDCWLLVFLKDAAIVQNAVAVASSPDPAGDIAPFSTLNNADFVAAGLKAKLFNLG
jgi:hypothetical protein